MSTQITACFNGCSFTWGEGFSSVDRDQYVYDRLVSKYFNFNRTNIAIKGSSNYTIFMRSAETILSLAYDIIFVQWSALNRIWLSPGPESYFFVNDKKFSDFRYRDLYISKFEKDNLRNLLLLLNHDYQNIIDLIGYCKILNTMSQQTNTKIFYINGLVPWTDDLTRLPTTDLSNSLSNYTKNVLLDFNSRDSDEIIKYFNNLQTKFNKLDQTNWINLFNSFLNNVVDHGPEGHHPGIKSHQWMADQIITHLTERKIV
jgi:hypothetical protein